MDAPSPGFEFEQPILDLQVQLRQLEQTEPKSEAVEAEIRRLRREVVRVTQQIYDHLSPWQVVQVARHKNRPHTVDYLALCFDEFVELHGDKHFGDDRAIVCGFAKLGQYKTMVIGHEKGTHLQGTHRLLLRLCAPRGLPQGHGQDADGREVPPAGHLLDRYSGAYPGIGAEERGQAQVIAENMYEMSRLRTPIICLVIGEGGSGGALGIGVGDRVAMLEHAYYSVISPEGCAGILWKSNAYAEQAATALRFTSRDLSGFGVVDDVIREPLGGAQRDHHQIAQRVKLYLTKSLRELLAIPRDRLLDQRYGKFRRLGVFLEGDQATRADDTAVSPQIDRASA